MVLPSRLMLHWALVDASEEGIQSHALPRIEPPVDGRPTTPIVPELLSVPVAVRRCFHTGTALQTVGTSVEAAIVTLPTPGDPVRM